MKRCAVCLVMVMVLGSALDAAVAPPAKPVIPAESSELQLEPGKTSAEIKVPGAAGWTYHVYLPTSYKADRKWPVMFVMSPGGGNAGTLKRYLAGAEMNNWILAVSVQSKNGFNKSEEAVLAMVGDVVKRLPIDSKRIYASGFSGGSRMAFWLSQEMKSKGFAGVLACGAGGQPDKMSPKTVVFGLCGSNCFNRWDMACTFKGLRNDVSRLRFFQGNHAWAESDLIAYGISWLNGCYLKTMPPTNAASVEEKKLFGTKLEEEIEKNMEKDAEKAYDWAVCLSMVSASPSSSGNQKMQALMKNPKVQLYAGGLKDMDLFVKKHFATSAMDYLNNNGTAAAKKDADKLAAKYKETGLGELIAKMGEPSVKP